MTLKYALLTGVVGCCLSVAPAVADDDDMDDMAQPLNDFFLSDSVFPQEQGEWQVSVGADFAKADGVRGSTLMTGLEYGITDSFQVEIEHTPYIRVEEDGEDTRQGKGNTALGFQKSWMNIGGSANSIALAYEHEFAVGDEGVADDDDGGESVDSDGVYVIIARHLDEAGNSQISLQAGREMSDNGHENFANLAAFRTLGDKHVLTGELNWRDGTTVVAPGIFWKPAKGLELGAGIAFNTGDADGHTLMTRLNYEFD